MRKLLACGGGAAKTLLFPTADGVQRGIVGVVIDRFLQKVCWVGVRVGWGPAWRGSV